MFKIFLSLVFDPNINAVNKDDAENEVAVANRVDSSEYEMVVKPGSEMGIIAINSGISLMILLTIIRIYQYLMSARQENLDVVTENGSEVNENLYYDAN